MPIEREFKFLVHGLTESTLFSQIDAKKYTRQVIQQGYLGKKARLRHLTTTHLNGVQLEQPEVQCIFTYKKSLRNVKGVLEIETPINPLDFKMGWLECKNTLDKVRYVLHSCDKYKWEIDFFYKITKQHNGEQITQPYLCMVECEVYDVEVPNNPPEEIRKYIIYSVSEGDKRFVNSRLSNVKYVERLIKEIDNEKS